MPTTDERLDALEAAMTAAQTDITALEAADTTITASVATKASTASVTALTTRVDNASLLFGGRF